MRFRLLRSILDRRSPAGQSSRVATRDAMAYLNLLYRQKADMDVDPADREKDIRIAEDLVDQAKAIMAKKHSSQSPQQ